VKRALFALACALSLSGCTVLKRIEESAGPVPLDVLDCFPKIGLWLLGLAKAFAFGVLGL